MSADADGHHDRAWQGWKCDDLTPDLCSLKESIGQIPVKGGLNVTYWKYEAVSTSNPCNQTRNDGKDDDDASANTAFDDDSAQVVCGGNYPILVIHGGPGATHNYMLPLKQQACRGRPVLFYDQAGCGQSALPANTSLDDYPWLLDPNYYALEELPLIVNFLGLDSYHIIGNSWGSLLSQLFALDAADDRLASMVLSGTFSDAQHYIQGQWDPDDGNLGSLPPFVQRRLHELEAAKDYDSEEYQSIVKVLTDFFTGRTAPSPDCVRDADAGTNEEIYVGMQGPSEFAIGGTLEHYNVTARLSGLTKLPVLLTSGKYDTMRPKVVEEVYKALPIAEWVFLERSGHMSMIDEPGPMNDAIGDFLNRVEMARLSSQPFAASRKVPYMAALEMSASQMKIAHGFPHALAAVCTIFVSLLVGWLVGYYSSTGRNRHGYEKLGDVVHG